MVEKYPPISIYLGRGMELPSVCQPHLGRCDYQLLPRYNYRRSPNPFMIVRETCAKCILSKSQVFDYAINPYVGCQHGCVYCYARFMRRFSGHREPWGEFVDVKTNAPNLLRKEISRKPPGRTWISGVCDPYQPLERKYELTRHCLAILVQHDWPITVQTKSPLVSRDLDLLRRGTKTEVGMSVTSGDEATRRLFEPNAPPVRERIKALEELHGEGIRTFAMIAPMLPGAERLATLLVGKVDYVLVDRLNYHYGDWVYRKYGLEEAMSNNFFLSKGEELVSAFDKQGVECRLVF
jgi:DNA repair photolyase